MGDTARIFLPVRYSAWLAGDLGRELQEQLQNGLELLPDVRVTKMPRGFLVEADEDPGPLLEAVHRAAADMEHATETAYPVFHREMGPVWTGTLQALFATT